MNNLIPGDYDWERDGKKRQIQQPQQQPQLQTQPQLEQQAKKQNGAYCVNVHNVN